MLHKDQFNLRTLFLLILLVAIGVKLTPYFAEFLPPLKKKENIVFPQPNPQGKTGTTIQPGPRSR